MILEVVQSKWSLTWYDPLGPRMCVLELMNGHEPTFTNKKLLDNCDPIFYAKVNKDLTQANQKIVKNTVNKLSHFGTKTAALILIN